MVFYAGKLCKVCFSPKKKQVISGWSSMQQNESATTLIYIYIYKFCRRGDFFGEEMSQPLSPLHEFFFTCSYSNYVMLLSDTSQRFSVTNLHSPSNARKAFFI